MNPDDDDIMGVEPAMDAMMGMSPATWEALPQPQMPPLVPGNGATHPSLLERMDRSRGTQTSRRVNTRLNEGEAKGEARFKRPCVFFGLGKCRWGTNCKYSHEPPHLMVNLTANYTPKTPYEALIKSLTEGNASTLHEEESQEYEILADMLKLFRIQEKLRVALAKQNELSMMRKNTNGHSNEDIQRNVSW